MHSFSIIRDGIHVFMLLVKPMAAFLTAAFCVTDTSKVKCVNQYSCWHYQKAFFFPEKKFIIKAQV